MSDDTRPDLDALIAAGRRDIADADRCEALGIAPAAHQLHRRLREVVAALAAEQERATGAELELEDAEQRQRDADERSRNEEISLLARTADERERADALALIIDQAPHGEYCATGLVGVPFLDGIPQPCNCWKPTAPSDALSAHDAEVKAQALDEVMEHLVGPYVSFAQLHTRAAALRKGGI